MRTFSVATGKSLQCFTIKRKGVKSKLFPCWWEFKEGRIYFSTKKMEAFFSGKSIAEIQKNKPKIRLQFLIGCIKEKKFRKNHLTF